jgi:hypothetical protein
MPVETFAEFVAEQAVAIAVGATAVVLAPKVAPGMARAAQNVKKLGAKVAVSTFSGATIATNPVMATSRSAYNQVIGGLQWYGEQWQDLVAEAKVLQASRIAGPELDPSNLPILVAEAPAISDLPGRLRLDLKQIRRNQRLVDECIAILQTLSGVGRVKFSSASGRILLFYDPDRYPTTKLLRQAIADISSDERISGNG